MAAQQTLKASPIQACRSSVVSATAEEHKTVLTKATVIGASAFIGLRSNHAGRGGQNGSGLRRGNCGFSPRLRPQAKRPLARSHNTIRMKVRSPYDREATVDKNFLAQWNLAPAAADCLLLDDLVGESRDVGRNLKVHCFRGFEIDHENVARGLLDRQISRF